MGQRDGRGAGLHDGGDQSAAHQAERVVYWPSGSSLLSGGGEVDAQFATPTVELTTVTEGEPSPPWLDTGGGLPQPYTLTEGVPGPTEVLTDDPASLVIGKPMPGSLWRQTASGELEWAPEGEGATTQNMTHDLRRATPWHDA